MVSELEGGESLTKISKIHFLIHPGFLSNDESRDLDFDMELEYGPRTGKSEHVPNEFDIAFEKYIRQAKTLKSDELMFAFTDTESEQYKSHTEYPYMKALREIKKDLGKRLIILGTGSLSKPKYQDLAINLKRIARVRGFELDKHVSSEAYGEILDACVSSLANDLNIALNLRKKTKIIAALSNLDEDPSPGSKNEVKWLKSEYPRIKF